MSPTKSNRSRPLPACATLAFADLQPGDHVLQTYVTPEELIPNLSTFVREGVEGGAHILAILAPEKRDLLLRHLQEHGAGLPDGWASSRLRCLTADTHVDLEASLDPSELIDRLSAAAEDLPAPRWVVYDMSEILPPDVTPDRVDELENRLVQLLSERPSVALCLYDCRRFASEVLVKVLHLHPLIAVGPAVYSNVYYVPTDDPSRSQIDVIQSCLEAMAQRYEAVEALRESEKLYRTTVDAMNDAVHVVDRDLRVVLLNEALYRNREKWSVADGGIGKRLFDMFPFLPNRVRQEYHQVFETGEMLITEEATTLDDKVVWTETRKIPILDEEGRVYRVATVVRDITGRKELERQMEERRIYLESVLTNAPDAIVTLGVDHRVLEWNPGAERLFGYTKAEALGRSIDDLITGSDPEIYQEATGFTEAVLSGVEVPPTESIRYCKDGRAVDVILAGSPIYAEGELVGSVVVYTDITQRRKAERELQQRTAQLEALRQVSLELTAQLDLEALLRSIASRAVQLLNGKAGGVYLYRPTMDVLEFVMSIGPNPAPIGTRLQKGEGLSGRIWQEGHPIIVDDYRAWEHRAVTYSGLPFTAVIGAPVRWGDEFLGVLNVTADPPRTFSAQHAELLSLFATQAAIAIRNAQLYEEARLRAEELADALSKLQELDRLKSQFVQNVSHEFRSPLSLIRGYADLLENGTLGELQPEQEKPVAVIARRSRMLSDLVQDITLILEAEVNPPPADPVAMDELAQAAVEDFQLVAQENGIVLEQDIPAQLPPVSGSVHYMRRVLDNLIGNAIKFTPEGGTILVRLTQKEDAVLLVVEDTGIGIAPEKQEQIFDRFYQVDGSTKRRYGGVGLGLALVKELVETYGGHVAVESVLGQGSTFRVSLPRYPVDEA